MISAVENHFGPGRSYTSGASHYVSSANANVIGSNNNLITTPCPIIALPQPMSASEFARPLPKPNRYNGSQILRNGISSPSARKYSHIDQSAPVNLAVSQSMSDNCSSSNGSSMSHKQNDVASLTAAAKPSSLESEQDAISNSIASLYQHKLAFGPSETTAQLYYPNFYARPPTSSVYGTHALYAAPPSHSSHPMANNRNILHHGVAYPHDSYVAPYLFGPTAYSPPAPARPGLSPHSPIGTITVGTSQSSANSTISAQSVLPANTSPPSLYAQQRETHYHMKVSSQNEQNSSNAKNINVYRSDSKDRESKPSHPTNGRSVDFKIPSGKEGSLKHRILTRPDMTTKPSQKSSSASSMSLPMNVQHSTEPKPSSRSMSNSNGLNNSNSNHKNNNNNNNTNSKNKNLICNGTSNFGKGSLIELSTGELKRVEDMRTEDFVISSSKNPNLQLIDTTVVKVTPQSKNMVVITLSYNNNNKISLETHSSHPFFVYGKGWASYSPESTLNDHGLKCQLLEVGDICISLTPREQVSKHQKSTSAETSSPENLSKRQQQRQQINYPHHQHMDTIPTTSTSTITASRPYPTFESIYNSHLRHQMFNQEAISRKYSTSMAPPHLPPTSNAEAMELMSNMRDGEAIDATMHSRKRRAWSTPEICDEKKNKPN